MFRKSHRGTAASPGRPLAFECLEGRRLLASSLSDLSHLVRAHSAKVDNPIARQALAAVTTTASQAPFFLAKEMTAGGFQIQTVESSSIIDLDDFRNDPRFAGIDGAGFSTVILDSGIDVNHPFFGPDSDSNGIADRIVYQWDFANGDANASDFNGHGSNVSSIVASSDATHRGMAPGANIIHLKVFTDSGSGNFGYLEQALQWVVTNVSNYNIVSVNMSLGDGGNYSTSQQLYGIGDELAALAALNVITVSASGNDFFGFGSIQGASYPAADANSLSVGAVYDASVGSFSYGSGATGTSGPRRIAPFSQRHSSLTTIMAPGAPITGANQSGGTVTMHGTSQASPHISGIAVLAQDLAMEYLGRKLTRNEFVNLLQSSASTINDGDDEVDNVVNTGLNFKLVNVFQLGNAIYNMANLPTAVGQAPAIMNSPGSTQTISVTYTSSIGIQVADIGTGDIQVTGPNGFVQIATFLSVQPNTNSSPVIATYEIVAPGGSWDGFDNGTYNIAMLAGQVRDTLNISVATGSIGTFEVHFTLDLGPDGFGYVGQAYPYQFEDIRTTGALILENADDEFASLTPGGGFSFPFYGTSYSTLYVSSNGLISFQSGIVNFTNSNLLFDPNQPSIAVLWDDLDAPLGGGVFWEVRGNGNQRRLILQWSTRYFFGNESISFQAILDEATGSIVMNYEDLIGGSVAANQGSSATVGIRGSDGASSHRLLAQHDQPSNEYVGTGKSLRFFVPPVAPLASVVARHLFYANAPGSQFSSQGNAQAAIDFSKLALLPGQSSGVAHYSNYWLGINGIIIDVANLPASALSSSDFEFATSNGIAASLFEVSSTDPISIEVLEGQGGSGSDRIKLTFADSQWRNTWLRVTVRANGNTGLLADDVFYFGNAVADMYLGNIGSPVLVRTNATDTSLVRSHQSPGFNSVDITNIYDVNKDGRVNATDTALVRQNQAPSLIQHFTSPGPPLQLDTRRESSSFPAPPQASTIHSIQMSSSPPIDPHIDRAVDHFVSSIVDLYFIQAGRTRRYAP